MLMYLFIILLVNITITTIVLIIKHIMNISKIGKYTYIVSVGHIYIIIVLNM